MPVIENPFSASPWLNRTRALTFWKSSGSCQGPSLCWTSTAPRSVPVPALVDAAASARPKPWPPPPTWTIGRARLFV